MSDKTGWSETLGSDSITEFSGPGPIPSEAEVMQRFFASLNGKETLFLAQPHDVNVEVEVDCTWRPRRI